MPTYTNTAKYLLRKLTGANLISDIDAGFDALAEDIDGKMVGQSSGPFSSRPTSTSGSPGIVGREYYAADTGQWFKDIGTGWVELGALAGDIKATGRTTAPSGWLLCDGAAVSRTTYAGLFAVIASTYGAGDGTSTFNVPDLRGRVPVGNGGVTAGRLTTDNFVGNAGGEEKHTLTIAEIPAHTHLEGVPNNILFDVADNAGPLPYVSGITNDQTGSAGGGGAHNNMPPYQVVNYIIKT